MSKSLRMPAVLFCIYALVLVLGFLSGLAMDNRIQTLLAEKAEDQNDMMICLQEYSYLLDQNACLNSYLECFKNVKLSMNVCHSNMLTCVELIENKIDKEKK